MNAHPLRVLVDDEAAALKGWQPARWHEASPGLARHADLQVWWLDRGTRARASGLRTIPYPRHQHPGCAADSLLLQQLCDQLGIDLFIAAGSLTPVSTPAVCLVDEAALAMPAQHHDLAWRFAARLLCADDAVRGRLLAARLDLNPQRAVAAALNWQVDAASVWGPALCDDVASLGRQVQREVQAGLWQPFFAEWTRLRRLQLAVDV
jgi:hypothetical protein